MYAKVFRSLWQGSLAGSGETWAVFVFLLAHADQEGFVDFHPNVIAALTGFDEERVRKALADLEADDPGSRSKDENGARIQRLDDHRDWGWSIVNYTHYRTLRDQETIRSQTRERVRKHRNSKKRSVTLGNAPKRQEEVEEEEEAEDFTEAQRSLLAPQPLCEAVDETEGSNERAARAPSGRRKRRPPVARPPVDGLKDLQTNTGQSWYPTESELSAWEAAYPAIDVRGTIMEMRAWLVANPGRRKTWQGMSAFVNRWLKKEQDRS